MVESVEIAGIVRLKRIKSKGKRLKDKGERIRK